MYTQVGNAIYDSMVNEPKCWEYYLYPFSSVINNNIGVRVFFRKTPFYHDAVTLDGEQLYPRRINSADHKRLMKEAWNIYYFHIEEHKRKLIEKENSKLGIIEVVEI